MKKQFYESAVILISVSLLAFAGCQPVQHHEAAADNSDPSKAICILYPVDSNTARGVITFEKVDGGIKVSGEITGISAGKHGMHVHQFGDCSSPGATSAGPHFDPHTKMHGGPSDTARHVGDLGNITASITGIATFEFVDSHLSLSGENSIIGRSMVVHAGEDDLASQPSGNSGGRIACGVIGIAE